MTLRRFFDDRHRELLFASPPKRVVSLVPSDTLTLADLGLGDALVGCTDYCVEPSALLAQLPRVGGTKNARVQAILDLAPDLVLANQEENTKSDLEELVQKGVRVFISFPKRVAEGLAHVARLARIFEVERDSKVQDWVRRGYEGLREAEGLLRPEGGVPTFCPIWMDPLMTIHGETYISDMLRVCGADNVFADRERRYPLAADQGQAPALSKERVGVRDTRYPRVTREEVLQRNPEWILLPNEPHPFSDQDRAEFESWPTPAGQRRAVVPIDGRDLCWYGTRAVDGMVRLRSLLDGVRTSAQA